MLRALSRVYFGFPGHDVPTDTFIGNVNLVFAGTAHPDRTLRFSNNSMDVLALPVPGGGGPAAYDRETLHFERVARRGRLLFDLTVGSSRDRARWEQASGAIGGVFSMTSGRQFGVY